MIRGLAYSFTPSVVSSVSDCFETRINDSFYSYNFSFDVSDFAYFQNETNFTSFDTTENISLIATHIPTWDYSINGSFMTDFRNYTLLSNVSNLSSVNLSIGNDTLITILGFANYSDVDLSVMFDRSDLAEISILTPFSNTFNVTLNYSPSSRVAVLPTYQLATTNGTHSWAQLSGNGTFTFVDDINFTFDVPTAVYSGDAVNLAANLTNYNASISDAVCTFYNGTDTLSTTNYVFTADAQVNVSCTSATLGLSQSANVSVSVVDAEVVNFENFRTYDSFPLKYRNVNFTPSVATCANVTLVDIGVANYSDDGYCAWNVSYVSGVNELVNITSTGFAANYTSLINVTSGRVYFDVREVFGEFVQSSGVFRFNFISNSSVRTNWKFVDETNIIHDGGVASSGTPNPLTNLYFRGNIFSTNNRVEFVN